jgi:hypothetical protein
MSQSDFFARLITLLEQAGIPLMVAGSLGSGIHGEPRATNDIDVVIAPTAEQLRQFLASLGPDYYVSSQAAQEAFQHRSMFNIIDLNTGFKADLILRKDRPFNLEEFSRRRMATLLGKAVPVVSPEDVILSKLEWSAITESERQIRDALGVAVVQGSSLDLAYVRKWAQELGVADRLEGMLAEAARLREKTC